MRRQSATSPGLQIDASYGSFRRHAQASRMLWTTQGVRPQEARAGTVSGLGLAHTQPLSANCCQPLVTPAAGSRARKALARAVAGARGGDGSSGAAGSLCRCKHFALGHVRRVGLPSAFSPRERTCGARRSTSPSYSSTCADSRRSRKCAAAQQVVEYLNQLAIGVVHSEGSQTAKAVAGETHGFPRILGPSHSSSGCTT